MVLQAAVKDIQAKREKLAAAGSHKVAATAAQ
jgi:hypothetical protein